MFSKIISAGIVAAVAAKGKTESPMPKYEVAQATKVEVAPVAYCKDGTEYGPAGCASFKMAEPEVSCPHPYKMDKKTGACTTVTHGESATVCPKGTVLHSKSCITEITRPVDVSCPKGVLSKDGCVVASETKVKAPEYKKIKYECPKGFKLEGNTCFDTVKTDAELVCEKGFQLSGHKCVSVETAAPFCSAGGATKGACVTTEVAAPDAVCPKHTKLDKKGNCVAQVAKAPVEVCEKGYTLSKKGKCSTRVLVTAAPLKKGEAAPFKCHGKTDEKGNCFQEHHTDSALVCDKGFTLKGKKCVSLVAAPADFECPKGFETSNVGKGAECLKTKVHKMKCPKGFKMNKGTCVKPVKAKAASVCSKGAELSGKVCKTVNSAPAAPLCPKGYELAKDACVKPGYAIPGKEKMYKPKATCPKGFKLDKQAGECVEFVKSKAVVTCEKGFSLEGHKCVAVHTVAPQTMCPKGFSDNGKGCQQVTYDHPHFACPKGSEDHGKKCYVNQAPAKAPVMAAPKK